MLLLCVHLSAHLLGVYFPSAMHSCYFFVNQEVKFPSYKWYLLFLVCAIHLFLVFSTCTNSGCCTWELNSYKHASGCCNNSIQQQGPVQDSVDDSTKSAASAL